MSIQDAISALVNDRRDLSEDEAADALDDVFRGEATQIFKRIFRNKHARWN